ncbi:MAG: VOC family protein [Acidobacteriota bacterium]
MPCEFDHLVVACADLDLGAAWFRRLLGVEVSPGGKHATMGTHNRLLRLGARRYLELLAIDPDAPPPGRPRWFALDTDAIRERAAREPFALTWVARTEDVDATVARVPSLGQALPFTRGPYRWRLTVPADGSLLIDGVIPAVIEWNGAHPADALPDSGCEWSGLSLAHPRALEMQPVFRALEITGPIELVTGPVEIRPQIQGPSGAVQFEVRSSRF